MGGGAMRPQCNGDGHDGIEMGGGIPVGPLPGVRPKGVLEESAPQPGTSREVTVRMGGGRKAEVKEVVVAGAAAGASMGAAAGAVAAGAGGSSPHA